MNDGYFETVSRSLGVSPSLWNSGTTYYVGKGEILNQGNASDLVVVVSGAFAHSAAAYRLEAGQCLCMEQNEHGCREFVAEVDSEIHILPDEVWQKETEVVDAVSKMVQELQSLWLRQSTTHASLLKKRLQQLSAVVTVMILAFFALDLIVSPLFTYWGRTTDVMLDEGQIQVMVVVMLTFSLGFIVWLIRLLKLSKQEMGLTLKNGGKAIFEGTVVSAPFVVIMAFVMHNEGVMWDWTPPFLGTYLAGIFFQEFFARGVLQQSFLKLFNHPERRLLAILASNGIFALSHAYLSLLFVLGSWTLGLVWALLMDRSRNILAPWISHLLVGGVLLMSGFDQFILKL